MVRQSLYRTKKLLVICTLFLVVSGGTLSAGSGIASAEEICVEAGIGTVECSETTVVDVRTYVVETTHIQSCPKGKSPHIFQQVVTTLDTHEVTEYYTLTKTYAFGALADVDETWHTTDEHSRSETIDVGKCRKVKS